MVKSFIIGACIGHILVLIVMFWIYHVPNETESEFDYSKIGPDFTFFSELQGNDALVGD
jgi:hypothetical protein